MNVLEQILEEIEKEAYKPGIGRMQVEGLAKAMRIIRSHMKDDEWTPESILPHEGQEVFVTVEYDNKSRWVKEAQFDENSFWKNGINIDHIIKAWQPRLQPYYSSKEERS